MKLHRLLSTQRDEFPVRALRERLHLTDRHTEVESTGGLTTLNVPTGSFGGVGRNNWETPGYGAAADRYSITVTGGVSRVTVR